MATYQIVPYLVTARLREFGGEDRPVHDMDANGLHLRDVLANIFDSAKGKTFVDPDSNARHLEIGSVHVGARAVFVVVRPGRSGIESTLNKSDGSTIARETADTEFVPIRYLFYFPSGGRSAILLAERAGPHSAIKLVNMLIDKALLRHKGELVLVIAPAVTEEIMRTLIKDQPIKALVFTRPRPNDPDGRHWNIANHSAKFNVSVTPPRRARWTFNDLFGSGDVDARKLLGQVTPILKPDVKDRQAAINALLDDGWESSMRVQLKNGAERLVSMTTHPASTMSFAVVEGDLDNAARPDDVQFEDGAVNVLTMFEGQFAVRDVAGQRPLWNTKEWENASTRWEVATDDLA